MSAAIDELRKRVAETHAAYVAAKQALHEATQNEVAIRQCHKCKKQIRSGHKWHFITVRGATLVEHRTCKYPDAYSDEQGKRFEKRWGKS